MIGKIKLFFLKKKLINSLKRDSFQETGWKEWIEGSKNAKELCTSCSEPGWMLHLAFWSGVRKAPMMAGSIAVFQEWVDASPGSISISQDDWLLLRNFEQRNPDELIPLLVCLYERCDGTAQLPEQEHPLGLSEALLLNASQMEQEMRGQEKKKPRGPMITMIMCDYCALGPLLSPRSPAAVREQAAQQGGHGSRRPGCHRRWLHGSGRRRSWS